MKKIKKQTITNLVNYQQFLKNNSLKKNQFKLKNILFENKILYNNVSLESYVIEFNNYENIYLPFTLTKIAEISTIKLKYENVLLFNYDLTYNILYQFNKIMFKNFFKRFYLFIYETERGRDTGRGRRKLHARRLTWDSILSPQDHALG